MSAKTYIIRPNGVQLEWERAAAISVPLDAVERGLDLLAEALGEKRDDCFRDYLVDIVKWFNLELRREEYQLSAWKIL